MEQLNGQYFTLNGQQGKGTKSVSLQQRHPRVFSFIEGLQKSGMPLTFSEKGYCNIAARFHLSVEELQALIKAYQKGGEHV